MFYQTRTLGQSLLVGAWFTLATACAPAIAPQAATPAKSVAESPAAREAKKFAPQAFAAAEKLRAEANFLKAEGRNGEAAIASEQAVAAYSEAFALARVAKAKQRIEKAQTAHKLAKDRVSELDRLQMQIAEEADAYEMRARVHLDTELVEDVPALSPKRARARHDAARQLTAEATLLCLASHLLGKKAQNLVDLTDRISVLDNELSHGSLKKDLYPRAAQVRSECLLQLSNIRRSALNKNPESAAPDRLLKELSESKLVFAYRDDRGVVVNLGSPLDNKGQLSDTASAALKLLGGTAKQYPSFPILLVTHTKKRNEVKRAEQLGEAAKRALVAAGAKKVTLQLVGNAQPLVDPRIKGAAARNERIEVVFVSPNY